MIVLGVDTAGGACSVAVRDGGRTVAVRQVVLDRGHAEALVPMILDTLGDAGLDPADIALYGVTVGPGAFTGLRVGLATVSGMALAHDCRIVGVSSFDAAAAAAAWHQDTQGADILVTLESRRTDLFACLFAGGAGEGGWPRPMVEPWVAAPETLAARLQVEAPATRRLVVTGDASARAGRALAAAGIAVTKRVEGAVDAGLVAAIAEARSAEASRDPPAPMYMRAPDARPAVPAAARSPVR